MADVVCLLIAGSPRLLTDARLPYESRPLDDEETARAADQLFAMLEAEDGIEDNDARPR